MTQANTQRLNLRPAPRTQHLVSLKAVVPLWVLLKKMWCLRAINNIERTVSVASFYMDETEIANIHRLEYLFYLPKKTRSNKAWRSNPQRQRLPRGKLAFNDPAWNIICATQASATSQLWVLGLRKPINMQSGAQQLQTWLSSKNNGKSSSTPPSALPCLRLKTWPCRTTDSQQRLSGNMPPSARWNTVVGRNANTPTPLSLGWPRAA